jgi:hypothetical protein
MKDDPFSKEVIVGSFDGSFTEKKFQLTSELLPCVLRSRIAITRDDDRKNALAVWRMPFLKNGVTNQLYLTFKTLI